ncbi:MAG: UvrD-helicase domain-containing protein [Gammaproteobacteria bacterium]|nr:UvrD-helicase domain-containing protein [Gammaproteobacteria bacterium]
MNGPDSISDRAARSRALDPSESFIVQAPAGSGKTGLLIQRFLVLLAGARTPEEIVAVTFTRKAAGEMRQRILDALVGAREGPLPETDHEKRTRELARDALERDGALGWQLLDNPSRLRIQTIDSLCTALVRQMPVLSRCGSVPAIAEDAGPVYREAARNTIAELESGAAWSDSIAYLVEHLDNRLDRLQGLVVDMLARREQWLRHIIGPGRAGPQRARLEEALGRVIAEALGPLKEQVPEGCKPELIELARYAGGNVEDRGSPIAALWDLTGLPGRQRSDFCQWKGLAVLMLTNEGNWRKSLTRNIGFPAGKGLRTQMKERMLALLESLKEEEEFRQQLHDACRLPPHRYTEEEWKTLEALVETLRVAAAHLDLVFRETGQADFPALTRAAIRALGDPEEPTDLALALDYRIRHLLIDEFQDTSFSQYELLKGLTAGWQAGDGHTLFLVGDPMQSIYRFREAEVGLFLVAREHGIGHLPLEFLRLEVNFRSQQGIVDWINQHFRDILPAQDDISRGAVSYAPSTAVHPELEGEAVVVHPSFVCPPAKRDDLAEAHQVVAIVRQAKAAHPQGTTAILVRSRSHLVRTVEQLQKAGLRFQAVEIDSLAHRPVVQDLLALTRALSHLGDRIAWLAVLRAPYCGLTLEDLHVLAGEDSSTPVIDLLHQPARKERLGQDGRSRLDRVLPVLDRALSEQSRGSLRSLVEGVWMVLGGPACVTDETGLEDAEVYFQLLERLGSAGEVPDIHDLNHQVEQLFALPDLAADASLQLMTVHRAKGLEFDTVIVPGLGRGTRPNEEKLLQWLERGVAVNRRDLLLAPIRREGENPNRIAAYLRRLEQEKGLFEDSRLLYVAATRARQRLELLGHVGVRKANQGHELKEPLAGALLSRLWPVLKDHFAASLAEIPLPETAVEPETRTVARTRLASDWELPAPPQSVQVAESSVQESEEEPIKFEWAGETARLVGTVVHRLLQHMGAVGGERITPGDLFRYGQVGRKMLARLGVPQNRLETAIETISTALERALGDERGQWILSSQHAEARCELALSWNRDGRVEHRIIDRTFVDGQGTRWIIDYKTGSHTGGGVERFLDQEQDRYRPDLDRYAGIMSKMDARPIRLGLYFPLLQGWREWPYIPGKPV